MLNENMAVNVPSGSLPEKVRTGLAAPMDGVQLGEKLRHARRLHKLTLKVVSGRVGCSESMLSKIETGRVSPSLELLAKLAEVLGTSIAALFDEENGRTVAVYHVGQRQAIDLGSRRHRHTVLERLIPYADGRRLNANLHVVPPGGGSDGTLSHVGEEVGFVVDGFIELTVDGQIMPLGPGSSFFFASSLPHSYRNVGTGVARIVWVNSPPY